MPCLRILSHSANRERRQGECVLVVKINCNEFSSPPAPGSACLSGAGGQWSVSGYLYSDPIVCLAAAHYYAGHDPGSPLSHAVINQSKPDVSTYSTLPLLNQKIVAFIFLLLCLIAVSDLTLTQRLQSTTLRLVSRAEMRLASSLLMRAAGS